ncbi:hypothetical protein VTJ49DRAFT_6594 [Mycothermus thermophilus]|uniref:Uncharacterized protein n=1 Tax=Humicola insolens TaxID=85995 RepID=A0ABR3V205_HUMIN
MTGMLRPTTPRVVRERPWQAVAPETKGTSAEVVVHWKQANQFLLILHTSPPFTPVSARREIAGAAIASTTRCTVGSLRWRPEWPLVRLKVPRAVSLRFQHPALPISRPVQCGNQHVGTSHEHRCGPDASADPRRHLSWSASTNLLAPGRPGSGIKSPDACDGGTPFPSFL